MTHQITKQQQKWIDSISKEDYSLYVKSLFPNKQWYYKNWSINNNKSIAIYNKVFENIVILTNIQYIVPMVYKGDILKRDVNNTVAYFGETVYFKEFDIRKKITLTTPDDKEIKCISIDSEKIIFEEDALVEISEYGDE